MPPNISQDSHLFLSFGILIILLRYIVRRVLLIVVTDKTFVFMCNIILYKNTNENIS